MARELDRDGCAASGAGRSFGAAKGCSVMDGALAVASHVVNIDAVEADRVDGERYVRPAEETSTDAGVIGQLGWRLLCARSRCLLQYEASNRSRISNLPWIARRGLPHWYMKQSDVQGYRRPRARSQGGESNLASFLTFLLFLPFARFGISTSRY